MCDYVSLFWCDDSGQSAGSSSCQPVTRWQIVCWCAVQATPHGCTRFMCVRFVLFIHSRGVARIHSRALHTQTQTVACLWDFSSQNIHFCQVHLVGPIFDRIIKLIQGHNYSPFNLYFILQIFCQKKPIKCPALLFGNCLAGANKPGGQRVNEWVRSVPNVLDLFIRTIETKNKSRWFKLICITCQRWQRLHSKNDRSRRWILTCIDLYCLIIFR